MNTHCTAILTSVAFGLSLAASAGELPSAQELMARHVAAVGGEALSKVSNRAAEFEFEMPMNGVYSYGVDYWMAPGKHYMKIDLSSSGVADFESGVVEGVAWQSHPMTGSRRLTGDEERLVLRGASLDPFADWRKYFDKAETLGEESVGGRSCYKVVFTPSIGSALTTYFDKETGLVAREEFPGPGGMLITSDLSEWKETQGIKSARLVEVGGPQAYTIRFTRVAYDVDDIPEDSFSLPATLATAAP